MSLGNVRDSYPEAIALCFLLHEVNGVLQFIGARGSRTEPFDEVLQAIVGGVLILLQRCLRSLRSLCQCYMGVGMGRAGWATAYPLFEVGGPAICFALPPPYFLSEARLS